jgi:hypothetical protein
MLAILRILRQLPGYSGNDSLLRDCLELLGLIATDAQVREHLSDLKEMALCKIEHVKGLTVVTIMERGVDVALGRIKVDGICEPGPECPY